MFCLSVLIKADIWRSKSWNTNKRGPNKCHFFSFAFARHAGSTRLHHSQAKKRGRRGGGGAGSLILHKGQNVFNLSCTINCLPLESRVGERVFIKCPDLCDFT